jgi:flagellin
MESLFNINGLSNSQKWKQMNHQHQKVDNKRFNKDKENIEETVNEDIKSIKKHLIDLQDSMTMTQSKINILNIAGETLNEISGNLNDMREKTLSSINQLEDYQISDELDHKLKNLDRIKDLETDFSQIINKNDAHYKSALEEFKNINHITTSISQMEEIKHDINSNKEIEKVISEINKTIESVNNARNGIDRVKDRLIANIKNLSVTLENVESSYSRIRNIEIATKTVKLTRELILNAANSGIKMELQLNDSNITELIS